MARVLLRSGLVAVALGVAVGMAEAQGQLGGASTSSRQADDRHVDESARQAKGRETAGPKPADISKAAASRSDSKPAVARQPEPARQAEPQRQREPQRRPHDAARPQQQPAHRTDSEHWGDPGPAWQPLGPAWRDLNDRPGVKRPGEDVFRATPGTFAPSYSDPRRHGRGKEVYGGAYGILVPYYYDGALYPSSPVLDPAPAAEPRADESPLGFLQLRVTPRTADVVVDGALAGTVDDFGGRSARMLPAGPHRVDISAPGFETLSVDVRVPENDTVTFTHDLEVAGNRPVTEPAAVPHKTMYIVPMCYIGDRPPLLTDMPAGCRVDDVRVIP